MGYNMYGIYVTRRQGRQRTIYQRINPHTLTMTQGSVETRILQITEDQGSGKEQ